MTDEYHMSDKEKDELAQSMGFGSWDEYINLDTSRIPEKETKTMLRNSSLSYVPDLTLSEEERDILSKIPTLANPTLANITRGGVSWQTHSELLEEICELRNEGLTWKDTADEFNRRHGTEYKSWSLEASYRRNKHLLSDEEE